jgi:hypothetical protein
MPVILKNNAFSTLATGATASDTGIVVTDGSQFPALSAGEYFYVTLVSQAGTTEIIKVTARVGNSMTVVRAQDGSTASGFQVGTLVEMRVNVASMLDSNGDYTTFDTVTLLLVDTTLAYTTVTTGDIVQTRSEGFSYRVAASGATDQHVTTAGGVKLYVQPSGDGSVSPVQFGAVPFTDAQDAGIDACLTYAAAQGIIARFPSGTWIKSTPLVLTVTGYKGLSIEGAGDGASIIRLNTGGNGIEINLSGNWWMNVSPGSTALRVQDVCFSTTNVNLGVGIKVIGQSVAGRPGPSVRFTRCMWRAHNLFTQFWTRGLEVIDCENTWYDFCRFECGGPGYYTANGVYIDGTAQANSPTLHHFTGCVFRYGDRSIQIGDFVEGVYLTNCTFVASNVGVYWKPSQGESGIVVDGGHMNTRQRWIDLENVFDAEIYGGHYFRFSDDATFRGILIKNNGRGRVNDNVFVGSDLDDGADIAIEVNALINQEQYGWAIDDNSFHKWATRAIWATSNANYLKVGSGNMFRDCAVRVLNQNLGSGNNTAHIEPKVWASTRTYTLAGGAVTENVDVVFPTGLFRVAPIGVVSVDSGSSLVVSCANQWASNTPTTGRLVFRNVAGGNVPAATYRVHVIFSEDSGQAST